MLVHRRITPSLPPAVCRRDPFTHVYRLLMCINPYTLFVLCACSARDGRSERRGREPRETRAQREGKKYCFLPLPNPSSLLILIFIILPSHCARDLRKKRTTARSLEELCCFGKVLRLMGKGQERMKVKVELCYLGANIMHLVIPIKIRIVPKEYSLNFIPSFMSIVYYMEV